MNDEKSVDHMWPEWQCICCSPPKPIYRVTWRWGTSAYHEDDHSPATAE